MRLAEQVMCAIADADAGKFDSALLHACIAVDATSKRLFPSEKQVVIRYVNSLRSYYWLLEPMTGGINLVETRFSNLKLKNNPSPDFAEIIYEVFRCNHAHCDEVPAAFSVTLSPGAFYSKWVLKPDELHMPDRVLWALLSVVVFSRVNRAEKTLGGAYLSLGSDRFPIANWWGREDEFRPVADRYITVRVKLDALERIEPEPGTTLLL
ncbi:MAG TPA: hypothetical protein VKE74_19515 [Gemmataceae bacterium]|nr:hypothetical protein [Gemmataceae bacterium]